MIDRDFELLVQTRLNMYSDHTLPEDFAQKLARSQSFQSIKHCFGDKAAIQNNYILPIESLPRLGITPNFTHAGLNINAGKMLFSK
jgi:hypothetical protein